MAAGVTICEGETAELTAIGGDPVWYDAFGDPVASGPTFTTPPLYATTTYQVADVNSSPALFSLVASRITAAQVPIMLEANTCGSMRCPRSVLKSGELYAGSAAMRTIELVDAVGVMRASRSAMVPVGQSRMELDFDIHPGNNYILTVSGTTDLWRSTSGVTYPYAIGTVANITGCSAGSTYYTYFYDWEVEVGGGSCASAMIPVLVEVEVCTGVEEALSLRGFDVYPNPNEGRFKVSLHLLRSAVVDLELSDMLGRTSIAERFSAPAGAVVREMDVSGLPAGIYTLTMRMEGRMFQRRVVVER
ncbi:MAG: T9SS type A sorting domain-containing protein [Flavobacteriales bacterium]|nr:T9SS type A sorting domain-containing protein [Flavobacteriales bacterium]